MNALLQDLRYGARMLLKNPGFTLIAALTLSLGIGANTTIFSAVNAFLFRPLPVERPDELAMVFVGSREETRVWNPHSYPVYVHVRDQNSAFSGLAAYKMAVVAISTSEQTGAGAKVSYTDSEQTEVVQGELVSGNYFEVLGVRPAHGRSFSPEEDRTPNAHPVVVLGYGFWQRRFRSDPDVVGRTVHLNGRPFTVIGIAPPSFKGTMLASEMNFWAPLMMQAQLGGAADWFKGGGGDDLSLLGRLKPGVTRRQAEAHLNILAQKLGERMKFNVVSEIEGRHFGFFGLSMLIAALALGGSGLVLLIACANVANMLLARATARSREIVIRLALGAGRWRIIRQLLTESMLLALLGGALGLLMALWGADLMSASHPFTVTTPQISLPMVVDFSPDFRVLSWALAVSLLTGLLFGLAPAWHAARTDLVPVLKNEEGGTSQSARRSSPRHLLVIAQLAISVVVLLSAGPFVKRLYRVQVADFGFQTANLLSVRLDPGLVGYKAAQAKLFFTDLVRQVEALPGVHTASLASSLPFGAGEGIVGEVIREGDPPPPPGQGLEPNDRSFGSAYFETSVGPKYFETMGTPLLFGREFTERDDNKAPAVVIINQAAARRLYGREQRALGKRLRLDGPQSALTEIIGVAQDGQFEEPRPYLFRPFLQRAEQTHMMLIVRAASAHDFKSIAENVRGAAQQLDARVPVFQLKVADDHVRPVLRAVRFFAAIAATLGALALGLASLGLYGVLSYAVSLRTKEIGIRMALGAQSADVLGLVIRQGMFLTVIGVVIGLIASVALMPVMNWLYGLGETDPLTFLVVALLLTLVALLACWIPARRATKVDPLIALRYE